MSDSSLNKVLLEIKKCKEELINLILASETRLHLKIEQLNTRILCIEEENSYLKDKVEYLERETKQKSIIIFGLNREPVEIDIDFVCTEILKQIDVKVEHSDISDFYCLGRNKNCPLKVDFTTKIKKQTVLKNANKLKGTGIVIAPDLTIKQREERKFLKTHLERHRKLGKESYIKGNKLVVDNKKFTIEDLREEEQKADEEQTTRKINSTPNTPTQLLIKESEEQQNTKITPIVNKNIVRKNLRSNSVSNQAKEKSK